MAATSNANHMHLTLSDRIYIEQALERRMKFKDIAIFIEKDPSTVSKEIRRHRSKKSSGKRTALCIHRSSCTKTGMCNQKHCFHLYWSPCQDHMRKIFREHWRAELDQLRPHAAPVVEKHAL